MRPRCVPTRETVHARGVEGLTVPMRGHVAGCAGCAEAVEDSLALDRAFSDARMFEYTAPSDVEQRVLARIGPWAVPDPEPGHRMSGKVAAAVAIATAATTAAVGAVVIVVRHRHRPV